MACDGPFEWDLSAFGHDLALPQLDLCGDAVVCGHFKCETSEFAVVLSGRPLDLVEIALFRGRTPAWGQATTAWVNFPLGFAQ